MRSSHQSKALHPKPPWNNTPPHPSALPPHPPLSNLSGIWSVSFPPLAPCSIVVWSCSVTTTASELYCGIHYTRVGTWTSFSRSCLKHIIKFSSIITSNKPIYHFTSQIRIPTVKITITTTNLWAQTTTCSQTTLVEKWVFLYSRNKLIKKCEWMHLILQERKICN